MVIAQTPESCVHSAMPLNVIKTGIVDHILNPEEMPQVILQRVNTILKYINDV